MIAGYDSRGQLAQQPSAGSLPPLASGEAGPGSRRSSGVASSAAAAAGAAAGGLPRSGIFRSSCLRFTWPLLTQQGGEAAEDEGTLAAAPWAAPPDPPKLQQRLRKVCCAGLLLDSMLMQVWVSRGRRARARGRGRESRAALPGALGGSKGGGCPLLSQPMPLPSPRQAAAQGGAAAPGACRLPAIFPLRCLTARAGLGASAMAIWSSRPRAIMRLNPCPPAPNCNQLHQTVPNCSPAPAPKRLGAQREEDLARCALVAAEPRGARLREAVLTVDTESERNTALMLDPFKPREPCVVD